MTLVVDASVAIKWFLPEQDSGQARAILAAPYIFHAPDLLRFEFANAIWKNVLKKTVARGVFAPAQGELDRIIAHWHDSSPFIHAAFEQACAAAHPVYDFVYIELARSLGTQVVTADKRFLAVAPKGLALALTNWKISS